MWKSNGIFYQPLCPSLFFLVSVWLRCSLHFCPSGHLTAVVNEKLFSFAFGTESDTTYGQTFRTSCFLFCPSKNPCARGLTVRERVKQLGSNGSVKFKLIKEAWPTSDPPIGFGQHRTQDTSAGSERSSSVWRQRALLRHEVGSHQGNQSNSSPNGNSWSLSRCKQQHYSTRLLCKRWKEVSVYQLFGLRSRFTSTNVNWNKSFLLSNI